MSIVTTVCEFAGDVPCDAAVEYTVTWDQNIWSDDCRPMAVCYVHAMIAERTFAADGGVEIDPPLPHIIAGMLADDATRAARRRYTIDA